MTSLDNEYFRQMTNKKIYEDGYIKYVIDDELGKGCMKTFRVMPGIELTYIDIDVNKVMKDMMIIDKECIEITYCLKGQVEIQLENEKYTYMSDGDITMFGYQIKALYCDFTSKHFIGIRILITLNQFIPALNKMLDTDEFKMETFFKEVFNADRCIISHGNASINHILKELYVLPNEYNAYLMKIKVVELILYLISGSDYKENETVYFSRESVEKIKYARNIILDNLDKFITIERLSQMVLMNTTDLEKGFKSIYGTTIFAYSRMNKMKKAKELLEDNKLSILEISLAVGYSNGGKFSKAFKETFGMLPTEYRREIKVKRSYRAKN